MLRAFLFWVIEKVGCVIISARFLERGVGLFLWYGLRNFLILDLRVVFIVLFLPFYKVMILKASS